MSYCYSKRIILILTTFILKNKSISSIGLQSSEPKHFQTNISISKFRGIDVPLSVSTSKQYDSLYNSPYYFEQSVNVNLLYPVNP